MGRKAIYGPHNKPKRYFINQEQYQMIINAYTHEINYMDIDLSMGISKRAVYRVIYEYKTQQERNWHRNWQSALCIIFAFHIVLFIYCPLIVVYYL